MKLYWISFAAILLISIYVPCEGFLSQGPLQQFIDNYVDIEKFKQEGIRSLNSTAMKHIWDYFKSKFNRHYSTTEEEKQRINIFREHLKNVLQSNLQEGRTYKLGMNDMSDLTKEEFLSMKTGLNVPADSRAFRSNNGNKRESFQRHLIQRLKNQDDLTRSKRSLHSRRNQNRRTLPDWFWDIFNDIFNDDDDDDNNNKPPENGFDWRTQNVVTSVKNQGSCGSCYAFATVAVMESAYAIKTQSQNPIDFSPQQLVDCSTENGGCNGGLFQPSVQYLTENSNKMATLDSYPYTSGDTETEGTCQADGVDEIDLGNIEYGDITIGDEEGLAAALVKYGPVFIGLNADNLQFYVNGVLNIPNCPNSRSDMQHALTLVGYGYDDDLQTGYWIIKNSWGEGWGESGYLRLAKDADNMCGVTTLASWGTLN